MLDAYTEDLKLRAINVTDVSSEVCVPVSKMLDIIEMFDYGTTVDI